MNMEKVAEKLQINNKTVSYILKARNIDTLTANQSAQKTLGKVVNQYDLLGNYIQSFPSCSAAAIALGKIKSQKDRGASSHISAVCNGKRKTAYGYIWKWS